MSDMGEIKVTVVGDFMIQKSATESDIGNVKDMLADADLRIGNMDTVLSLAGQSGDKFSSLRGSPDSISEVKEMGFEVLTLANNHAMDYGSDGLIDMIQGFASAEVTCIGAGENLGAARDPFVFETEAKRIAVFSFACTLPPGSAAMESSAGIAPIRIHQALKVQASLAAEQPGSSLGVKTWVDEKDLAETINVIEETRRQVDHVVVIIHWGVPKLWRTPVDPQIQDYQYELGRALVAAGVDIVLGNHPHELHAIEYCDGVPIAFSLGNFWIDTLAHRQWMARESVAVRLTFGGDGLSTIELMPLMLTEQGIPEFDPSSRSIEILRSFNEDLDISPSSQNGWFTLAERSTNSQ